ncbi:MAG: hypothetical protein GC162_12045 [Planctomycetes bacterium]|nr:hypothetical protein [Planctomycetota bacterium]
MSRIVTWAALASVMSGVGASTGRADTVLMHTIGTTFTGNSLNDPTQPGLAPPDSDGAVGIDYYVEFTNGAYAVYDKNTGALATARVTDKTFWTNAGISAGMLAAGVSDPRIIYDAASQRWFAIQVTTSNTGNQVLVAVSKDSNPLNGFKATNYTGAVGFADYPVLGVNADGITLSSNNFTSSSGSFTGTTLTSIPKADLLWSGAGTPSVANRTSFNSTTAAQGFTLQGASSVDPSIGHTPVVGVDSNFFGKIDVTNISNVTGPGAATLGSTDVINVATTSSPGDARQPDGTKQIDGLDDRIGGTAAAYLVGSNIFMVHGISVNSAGVASTPSSTTHDALRVTVIDEATHAVVAESTLFSNTYDYIMPSIAVNPFGDIVVGFTRSGGPGSVDGFLSSFADVGKFDGSSITWDTPFLAGSGTGPTGGGLGQANYHLFGVAGERWGDYSTTNVDPTDPYTFWTVQEFAGTGNVWRTQITEINLVHPVDVVPSPLALQAGAMGLMMLVYRRRRRHG